MHLTHGEFRFFPPLFLMNFCQKQIADTVEDQMATFFIRETM